MTDCGQWNWSEVTGKTSGHLIASVTPFKAFLSTASVTGSTLDGGFSVIPGPIVRKTWNLALGQPTFRPKGHLEWEINLF